MRGIGLGAIAAVVAMLGAAPGLRAQAGTGALPAATAAVPASYIVGPNDVLAMTVFGDSELNDGQMRVDSDGTIHTPYGKTPVKVSGLTVAAIRGAIAAELVRDQLAVDPEVEVRVVNPQSHPVVITGQGVRQPGTIQAVQPIRLLDALTLAGGLTDNHSAVITILRRGPHGRLHQRKLWASQVLDSLSGADNPWLTGGEEVRVLPGGNVYLSGAVNKPGAYPLSDSESLTVRKLLARASGLTKTAAPKQTQLIHHVGAANQSTQIVNLNKILDGKAPDIHLAADDMIYVPWSTSKKVGYAALQSAVAAVTIAGGDLLVR
jgi:polysaccharide export outer membrane protein